MELLLAYNVLHITTINNDLVSKDAGACGRIVL
jgi:hypothetical protein